MATVKGYRNLVVVSSIEEGKDILIRIIEDLYQCKRIIYDSKNDMWEVEKGKEIWKEK